MVSPSWRRTLTRSKCPFPARYNHTGVGASYIIRPTGNHSCDSDPQCNLRARLAANRELIKSCGIPLTFVAETLHSPFIGQGTVFPMPVTMGATWNRSLLSEVGAAIATQCTACGITRGFSPEINVCIDPRFGRTQENLGSDALHVATLGVALMIGLQGGPGDSGTPSRYFASPTALSCEAKHLAAYGSGNMDGAPADVSPQTLHDVYLKPWKKFFAAGGRGAMLSHNSINGIPAHMHNEIMTDTIRGRWNHSRVFFASDFGDIDRITGFNMAGSLQDAAVLAIKAGMDQALGGQAFTFLADAVATGQLDRQTLERAATATLREKIAGGLFDKAHDGKSDAGWGDLERCRAHSDGGVLDRPADRALARRVAMEGTVLLKNGLPSLRARGGAGRCQFRNSSDCDGEDIAAVANVPSAQACCDACQQHGGCSIAVYIPPADRTNGRQCLLKSGCRQPQAGPNRVRCEFGDKPEFALPITPAAWASIKRVAIVGPNAANAQTQINSYSAAGAELTTVASSAQDYVPHGTDVKLAATNATLLIEATELGPAQREQIDDAVAVANSSDLVIAVLGDSMNTCGEATDRISLDLPGVQMQLLTALAALRKPLVVVLAHGRPVTFGPGNAVLDGVDVLLASWIGGEEHGPAVWSIINGEFNPSGRLAQPWPRAVGYVGTHVDSQWAPQGLLQGDYQGMGWRDAEPNGPMFPFGFGLSFGGSDTFGFASGGANITASASSATFSVAVSVQQAAAASPGGAVVQLYFSQDLAQAVRPSLMLLAFAKVDRAAASQATITVQTEDLGYFHPLTKTTSVDTGVYTLHVGASSADLHATTKLILH